MTKAELKRKALELCYEIEKMPASPGQTMVSTMANILMKAIDDFESMVSAPDDQPEKKEPVSISNGRFRLNVREESCLTCHHLLRLQQVIDAILDGATVVNEGETDE